MCCTQNVVLYCSRVPREAGSNRAQQFELKHDFPGAPKEVKATVYRKAMFRDRKSDNQANAFHLGATTKYPPRCLPVTQSAPIHAQRQKLSKLVLSNRTILTLSCRHPVKGLILPLIRWPGPELE